MPVTVRRWEDPTSWNDFTASLPMAHFQQSWEWGELAPQLGGTALRLAATDGGRIVGAMQLFVNPLSHTGRTHLYVPRGPAIPSAELHILGPLLDAARAIGREHRAVGIRLEPNVSQRDYCWKNALRALGLRTVFPPSQPRSSWMLNISAPAEQVLREMKSKTRYNVRLAAKRGVEVVRGDPADLTEFYPLFEETAARDRFFIHPRAVYERMFRLFADTGRFALLQARHEGRLIAAITLTCFGDTCWYLQGASSNEHRNLMATYLLQWEAMNWAKAQGCSLYDFRAVPDLLREDQDMYGVYRFKEGFGGYQFTTLHSYGQAYDSLMYGGWQLYFAGRFRVDAWRRRRSGQPARQFA